MFAEILSLHQKSREITERKNKSIRPSTAIHTRKRNSFKIFIKISFIFLWWRMILKKMKSSAYLIRANGTYNYNIAKGKPHSLALQKKQPSTAMRPLQCMQKGKISM